MVTIYLITNDINKKKYVGQTTKSLKTRFARHCWASSQNSQVITKAIAKYGKEHFSIQKIDEAASLEEANQKEVLWAKRYNCFSPNGYNLLAGGRKYLYMAQETKDKIALAHLGKKVSAETKLRLSISHLGYKTKNSTKRKLSRLNKGKKPHANTNKAASEKNCKKYILKSPSGEEICVTNMKNFCLERGLYRSNMSHVVTGKKKSYKGWTLVEDCGFLRETLGSRRNKN